MSDIDTSIIQASSAMDIPSHKPAMTLQEAKEFFDAVEEAIKTLIPKEKCIAFKDKKGNTHYAIPNAYLQKLALYFGVGILEKPAIYKENADGSYSYHVIALAYRGGRAITDQALVSSKEKDFMDKGANADRKEHDVLSMASTRSQSRVIRKFFGIEEPSAEELGTTAIDKTNHDTKPAGQPDYKVEFCPCKDPQPKFMVDQKTGFHHCARCTLPVRPDVAERLIKSSK